MKKVKKTEELTKLFEDFTDFRDLYDYLRNTLVLINEDSHKYSRTLDYQHDRVVIAVLNEALKTDDYVEALGKLTCDRGFLVDLAYEALVYCKNFADFRRRINLVVGQLN